MRINRQKRFENIQRALELIKTHDLKEVAELLGVVPGTIRNYLSHAQTHNLATNEVISVVCADCGGQGPLHHYQNKLVCSFCLNPPIAYDISRFLGRHTAILDL